MDSLYANLENYEEEQTIAQLKTENADLKAKLQEYSSVLESLQKEFDKLSSEHKKLELNYSSLLKTAKAEIERKSEIIKNLNNEKDAMVLNSIQNRSFVHKPWLNKVKQDLVKKAEPKSDKRSEPDSSNVSNKHVGQRKDPVKEVEKKERCSETKENVIQNKETVQPKPCSRIRDRRKSMPAFSVETPKFSSDEEKGAEINEYEDKSNDRHYRRDLELTHGRPFSNELHRSRYSKNYDNKYKYRDKNEFSQKTRRHSPGLSRSRSRGRRDNDYYDRIDERRERFGSPPIDRFNPYPQRGHDSFKPYSKNTYQEHDRFKFRNHDKYPMKHKFFNEYEEFNSKRRKLDIHHRGHEEEGRHNEQQIYEPFDDYQFMTCQSPDGLYFEANPNHQIREIKLNASTKLEDPRTVNKKYEMKIQEGKTVISTVKSKDLVLHPIDKSKWHLEIVNIPEALKIQPPDNTASLVDILSKDVSNTLIKTDKDKNSDVGTHKSSPISNLSNEITKPIDGQTEICTENIKKYKIPKQNKSIPLSKENNTVVPSKDTSVKNYSELSSNNDLKASNCKNVSKIGKEAENAKSRVLSSIADKGEQEIFNAKCIVEGDLHLSDDASECESPNEAKVIKICNKKKKPYSKDTDVTNKEKTDSDRKHGKCKVTDDKKIRGRRKTAKKDNEESSQVRENIVKTKDKEPIQPKDTPVNEKPFKKDELKSKDTEVKEIVKCKEKEHEKISIVIKKGEQDFVNQIQVEVLPVIHTPGEVKEAVFEQENCSLPILTLPERVVNKKGNKSTLEKTADSEPKTIETNDKQPNNGIKNKFSDLFGDSSSLICPEDIGIASIPVPLTQTVPYFEDAQDGTDVTSDKIPPKNGKKHDEINIKDIYENLEVIEPTKNNDVVKTVIISSGIQPKITPDNTIPSSLANNEPVVEIKIPQIKMSHEGQAIKALATSTPHKEVIQNQVDKNSISKRDNRDESYDSSLQNITSSVKETDDVPDVRIFVRRRRKMVKKT